MARIAAPRVFKEAGMLKVLIAEDDLLIADMAEELLVEHGYNVCGIGRNVSEAIALARRHQPDLAILDVRLADGDLGTQIATELADLQRLGILYVTGNVAAVMSTVVRGHACLAKPYRGGDLLRSLEIVAGMVDADTPTPPFPPNFHLLPTDIPRKSVDPACDVTRVRSLRRQQVAVAGFGSFALGRDDLAAVLAEAARVCAEGLGAPYCKIYRYRPAQDDLLREAGYGWHAGVAQHSVLRADVGSPEGRAFVTRQPVIWNEQHKNGISGRAAGRKPHQTVSTVDVVIKGGDGRPYGVLGASNNAQQDYDQNDVDFLSCIAGIVAESVACCQRTSILNQTIEQLRREAEDQLHTPEQAEDAALISPAGQTGQPLQRRRDKPVADAATKFLSHGAGATRAAPHMARVPREIHGRASIRAHAADPDRGG
jgi:CheY-like chemotaxis protein